MSWVGSSEKRLLWLSCVLYKCVFITIYYVLLLVQHYPLRNIHTCTCMYYICVKVAVATGVADEALGNIRTVRAFAMEDREVELYCRELKSSQWYNERLGLGIAAFQALSNIAINGRWRVCMCVLFMCETES